MVNKEELIEIVMNSFSYANVCRNVGLSPVGGNINTVKKYIKIYDINIDHFTGQCWNTGDRYQFFGKKISLDEILKGKYPDYGSNDLRRRLIKNGLKEEKCEVCGIIEWNNDKISFHLHHIDGDSTNHKLENLKILCPNCHSQTDTFGSKNNRKEKTYNRVELLTAIFESKNYVEIKKRVGLRKGGDNNFIKNILFEYNIKITDKEKIQKIILEEIELDKIIKIHNTKKYYCECGKEIKRLSKRCSVCDKINQRKVKDRPSKSELILMIKESSLEAVGRKYNVSGNAVKKWLKMAE